MRIPLEVPRGGGLVKEARRRSYAFRDSSFMASPLYRDGRKKDPRGETKEECEEREKRMTMRMKGSLSRESGDTLRIEQEEETKRTLKRKVEVLKKRKEDTLSLSLFLPRIRRVHSVIIGTRRKTKEDHEGRERKICRR